jgi:hypothetical protein
LLCAEREVSYLETILRHCEISDLALNRALKGLGTIRAALEVRRPQVGLAPKQVAA